MAKLDEESGEDRLIATYFRPIATHPGAFGLTDDAAAIAPPPGCDLVLKTDGVISGVHFFADDPADAVARKALRINLSDLAAKGAAPLGFLHVDRIAGRPAARLAGVVSRAGCARTPRITAARCSAATPIAVPAPSPSPSRRSARCRTAPWSGAPAPAKATSSWSRERSAMPRSASCCARTPRPPRAGSSTTPCAIISWRAISCRSRALRSPNPCAAMRAPPSMSPMALPAISPSSAASPASVLRSRSSACRCRRRRARRSRPTRRRSRPSSPAVTISRSWPPCRPTTSRTCGPKPPQAGVALTEIGVVVAGPREARFVAADGHALAFERASYSHF